MGRIFENRLKMAIFETSNGRILDPDDPNKLKIGETYFFGTCFYWLKFGHDMKTAHGFVEN